MLPGIPSFMESCQKSVYSLIFLSEIPEDVVFDVIVC